MDLVIKFPSVVYPLIKQGFRRANHLSVGDSSPSPSFGRSLSRTAFTGDRISWPQEKASSSMGRSKKGSVCCKKPSDERSSSSSKLKQEEIISLFRRIQSSISKGDSQGAEEKNRNGDGSSENKPLSKAIIDVLEKPRKITAGVTGVKAEEPPKRERNVARPGSNFAKRSPYRPPPTTGPIGKLPITKSDKGLEEKEKEEKPPLIETMKLAELKEVAKKRGIKGYSKLKKSEILELLRSS